MLSIWHRPSNGTDRMSLREAYRQRLLEIAAATPVPSATSSGSPGAEASPPDAKAFSWVRPIEELRPASLHAASREVPREGPSGTDAFTVARARLAGGLANLSATMARSSSECSAAALAGLDRSLALDRGRLRTGPGTQDSLAGDVARLDAEFGHIRELCRAVQEGIRIQANTVAALEKALRSQSELIDAQVKDTLCQVSERFEVLNRALDAQTEAAGKSVTASYRDGAAA